MLSLIPNSWDINWLKGDAVNGVPNLMDGCFPSVPMIIIRTLTGQHIRMPYDERDRVTANANLRYDITDWLFLNGRIGTEKGMLKVTSIMLTDSFAATWQLQEQYRIYNQRKPVKC